MWSSEANNSAQNESYHQKPKGLNEKAPAFKSQLPDPLELLIEDLHLNDSDSGRSGATTQERTLKPEDQSGLSTIDTLNEWDQGFPQITRRSPTQGINASIDREFEYHGQPSWSSLEIVPPATGVTSSNSRREVFPLRQGRLPSRTYSQEEAPYSNSYGSISTMRTATYDSYQSPMNAGYHRQSNAFTPPSANSTTSNYFPASQPLAGARPAANVNTPKAPRNMEPVDGYVYQVQFKRAHKNYILAPSAPRNIIPGDFVKVEADRGEDMGIVLSKLPVSEFEEVIPTAGYRGRGFSSGQGERKFLFRLATAEERMALVDKVRDEEQALTTIREKAAERCLPMVILDAEYQFDRHKLTFFFEADRRIDFRELVSELFSQYKTRIWMQQVDTSTLAVNDAGTELARATGFLPKRDDRAYLQMAHGMMRGGGSGAAALSPSMSRSTAGYGNDDGRGPPSAFGDAFAASGGAGSHFGVMQGGGRGGGNNDRKGGAGATDPWMYTGQH